MMFSCVIYRNYRGDLAIDIMKRRGASQELCEFMSKVHAQKSFSVISKRHNNKDVITELVDSFGGRGIIILLVVCMVLSACFAFYVVDVSPEIIEIMPTDQSLRKSDL